MQVTSATLAPLPESSAFAGKSISSVAVEFEGLLTSQLLKQMRQTTGEGGLFPGDDSDTLGGLFDMMMGKYLAKNNSLGLAEQLSGHLPDR